MDRVSHAALGTRESNPMFRVSHGDVGNWNWELGDSNWKGGASEGPNCINDTVTSRLYSVQHERHRMTGIHGNVSNKQDRM